MRSEWPGRSLRPFAAERVHGTDGTGWQRWCGDPRSSNRRAFQRLRFADHFHVVEKIAVVTCQRGDRFARIDGAAASERDHGVAVFSNGHGAALPS